MSADSTQRGGATYTVSYEDNPSAFAAVAGRLRSFVSLSEQAQKLARNNMFGATWAAPGGGHPGAPHPAGLGPDFAPAQRGLSGAIDEHARAHRRAAAAINRQSGGRNLFADLPVRPGMSDAERRGVVAQRLERYGQLVGAGVDLNPDERHAMAQTRAMRAVFGQQDKATNAPPEDRNLFAGLEGGGDLSDREWTDLLKRRKAVETEAVKNGTEFNQVERGVITQSRSLESLLRQGAQGGMAGKVASAVGWLPGIPGGQNAYMAQMALESLGLPAAAVLGGTLGAVGLAAGAAGYLGVSNTLATLMGQSRLVAGLTGGGNAAAPRPLDQAFAKQLRDIGYAYSLTEQQTYGLLPALAPYNLPQGNSPQVIADTIKYGLSVAGQAGIAPQQGVQLMAQQQARTGQTAVQAAQALQHMNDAAQALHVPLQQVNTDLLNVGGSLTSGADLAGLVGLSAMGQRLGVTGTELAGGFMNSTGMQAMQQAAMLGMSPDQFAQARQTPQGQARIVAAMQAKARAMPTTLAAESYLEMGGFVQPGSAGENQLVQQLRAGAVDPQQIMAEIAKQSATLPSGQALANETNANTNAAQAISADTVNVQTRLAILSQQLTNDVVGSPGAALGAAGLGFAQGVPSGAGWGPLGALVTGILGAGKGLLAQAQQPDDVNHNINVTLTDAATGKAVGQFSYSTATGTTTRTPTLTPGQGTPPNVAITPPNTPTSSSLNGGR